MERNRRLRLLEMEREGRGRRDAGNNDELGGLKAEEVTGQRGSRLRLRKQGGREEELG